MPLKLSTSNTGVNPALIIAGVTVAPHKEVLPPNVYVAAVVVSVALSRVAPEIPSPNDNDCDPDVA